MTPNATAHLEALGTILRVHGLTAVMTPDGLRVANPDAVGCCAPHPADTVSVRRREDDGERAWFLTSWGEPLAPVTCPIDALVAIKGNLAGGAA